MIPLRASQRIVVIPSLHTLQSALSDLYQICSCGQVCEHLWNPDKVKTGRKCSHLAQSLSGPTMCTAAHPGWLYVCASECLSVHHAAASCIFLSGYNKAVFVSSFVCVCACASTSASASFAVFLRAFCPRHNVRHQVLLLPRVEWWSFKGSCSQGWHNKLLSPSLFKTTS